jgi:hypothetical protein
MKTRNCPSCDKELIYENHNSFYRARKCNSKCKSCMQSGENNSFHGKIHTEETKDKLSKYNSGSNNKMYGKPSAMSGRTHTEETIQKMSDKRTKYWETHRVDTTEFEEYRNKVDALTNKQPIKLLENFDKRGVSGLDGAYHLDHITSVWWGFHNNIPPEEIAHISNLRMIPWLENQKKWKWKR